MKKTSKALASTAALCLVLSTSSVFAAENTAVAPERLSGANRVDTAVKIAEKSFNEAWKGQGNAILSAAADANLVDSLAVAPLSYQLKAPILLNDAKDSINADTLKALKANNVKTVYIATGEGVISNKAKAQLEKEGFKVERLGGKNRYETAKNILDTFKKNGGDTKNVALVSGNGLADALSVAPEAARKGMPILLTDGKDAVAANLAEVAKAADTVYAIGGNGIISDALVQQLKADRVSGHSRYETNAAVIKKFAGDKEFSKIYLGNGQDGHLVDSLTGSVLAAQSGSPIVLADKNLADATKDALKGKVSDQTGVVALGGEAVVSDNLVKEVTNIANESPEYVAADKAVKAYEDAKITTAGEITAAKALKAPAVKAIEAVKDQAQKDALNARIAAKDKAISEAEAKMAIKVESVSAINQKMIQIKFNKAVDKTSATTATNYTIDGVKLQNTVGYVSLGEDGKTVNMFLTNPIDQDQKVTVGVSGVLEDKTYNKIADYSTTLTIKDTTNPTLVNVEAKNGNKDVYLTFNESLNNSGLTLDMFTLNGQALSTFGATNVAYAQDTETSNGTQNLTNKVKITFASKLADGEYTLAVKDNKIVDPAGFYAIGQKATFKAVSNNESLKAEVVKATAGTQGTIEIKFNKAIGTIASGYKLNEQSVTPVLKTGTKDTIVISGSKVYEGSNIVEIPGIQRDSFGNKLGEDNVRITATGVKDTVKPSVENVYALSDKKVRVRFTENVNVLPFVTAKANWTIKDAAGDVVYSSNVNTAGYTIISGVEGDNTLVDINLANALPGSNYKLEIKGVKDGAGNEMDAYNTTFVSPDKTAPTLATSGNKAVVNSVNKTIEVFFSEPMMANSITDKNNFMYTTDGTKFVELPTTATLEAAANGKSVKITFPGTIDVTSIKDVKVLGVKDIAGNTITNGSDVTGTPSANLGVAPKVVAGSAVATADADKVTVKFDADQQLTSIDKAEFANFLVGKSNAAIAAPDNATVTGKTVTLTYDKATNLASYDTIKAAGKALSLKSQTFVNTKNAYGDSLTLGISGNDALVKDEIAPELIASNPIKVKSSNEITITFNEDMSGENLGELKDDVVITTAGAYTTIDAATVAGDTITLKTEDNLEGALTLALVPEKISMKDVAGNVFKPTNANKNLYAATLTPTGAVEATEGKATGDIVFADDNAVETLINGAQKEFTIAVDGGSPKTITIASTVATRNDLVSAINSVLNGTANASFNTENKLVVKSVTKGQSSSIAIAGTDVLAFFGTADIQAGTDETAGSVNYPVNFAQ
ncbi:putative cell surface protein [Clostridium sporogenes]|nr:cell wall-binding repeat-containing protein [Clostridium sporogenes]SUY64837.1 putative cell surface protein [Clostridium sporogenes]